MTALGRRRGSCESREATTALLMLQIAVLGTASLHTAIITILIVLREEHLYTRPAKASV